MRLEQRYRELLEKGWVKDRHAVTFGYPKIKVRWVLPIPEFPLYSFEPFQPFLLSFDEEGITFFPLDLNHQYRLLKPIVVLWHQMKHFTFHAGWVEHTLAIQWETQRMVFRLPKYKMGESWMRDNNAYLLDHDYFYREWKLHTTSAEARDNTKTPWP